MNREGTAEVGGEPDVHHLGAGAELRARRAAAVRTRLDAALLALGADLVPVPPTDGTVLESQKCSRVPGLFALIDRWCTRCTPV